MVSGLHEDDVQVGQSRQDSFADLFAFVFVLGARVERGVEALADFLHARLELVSLVAGYERDDLLALLALVQQID